MESTAIDCGRSWWNIHVAIRVRGARACHILGTQKNVFVRCRIIIIRIRMAARQKEHSSQTSQQRAKLHRCSSVTPFQRSTKTGWCDSWQSMEREEEGAAVSGCRSGRLYLKDTARRHVSNQMHRCVSNVNHSLSIRKTVSQHLSSFPKRIAAAGARNRYSANWTERRYSRASAYLSCLQLCLKNGGNTK